MGEILEFGGTLIGEEFQRRLYVALIVAVAKGLESRIFREFPAGVGQAHNDEKTLAHTCKSRPLRLSIVRTMTDGPESPDSLVHWSAAGASAH